MPRDFCHLHVHSEYSILDGIIKIKDLVKKLKDSGMSSCALTDHGNLHGAIEFYRQCKEAEIRPLLGLEAHITWDEDGLDKSEMFKDNQHLVLLAMNDTGWKNLIWLISNANINNFYYKPRIWWEHLKTRNEGLIATSACLGGVVAKPHQLNKKDEIVRQGSEYREEDQTFLDPFGKCREKAVGLKEMFGDRFYLEIQENKSMWEQTAFNNWAILLSEQEGIPLVLTTDAHYLNAQDYKVQALIDAQKRKKTMEEYEEDILARVGTGYYIKTPDEMWEIAEKMDVPDAFHNTIKIAEQCNVEIELGKYKSPEFDITSTSDYQDFLKWKNEV